MMGNPKLIFVVDDDPFINMLVVKRFSSEGYQLEAYSSGEECLEALNKNPDLIILDYLFAKEDKEFMNGMEVLDKIKLVKPDMSVIMLSGQDNGEVVLELARKGIDDYVIKDHNLIDNLHIAIKELFERKS
ncbi:MAG TPA: response regulator [Bacteroidales bacterium]|nr:response regulator [Bacteroidales bacterium]OQB65430.1 MAG: putative transcriptional regulatory protein TcrX [Bacteroidetes bacterium ADurb.Bin145]NMD04167.1 response regulator [Bacteroidales bacterium]HOU02900.1 response regulator [Bacteroidales bacterium]HQG63042.1 response regulator [Bacteroidales bacterium]